MNRTRWVKLLAVTLLMGALAVLGTGSTLAWGPGGSGSGSGRGMMAGSGSGRMMGGAGWSGGAGPSRTASSAPVTAAPTGYGMMGNHTWNGMPGTPGPMGSYGYCCGSGMMGGYYGGPGMMGGWWGATPQNQGNPISLGQATTNVQNYLTNTGNSDLTLGEVMEFQYNFYALVKEKSTGIGAFELLVDRYTGAISPEPGPNMMWNTKYGMMGGWGSGQPGTQPGPMTVTADQAKSIAQQWLNQSQSGSKPEDTPDTFYGYYTMDILNSNGQITGTLSVNGYTGAVWYHTWHGTFVAQ